MHASARHRTRRHLTAIAVLALVGTFAATIPAAGFSGNWTSPTRVFSHDAAPTHTLAVDAGGRVHIATERGSGGVWYVTNASGAWVECQVSSGNDRRPSIALDGGTVHIGFVRLNAGEGGVYTASSDQPATAAGCGWAVRPRFDGAVTQAALAVRAGVLSIAFRAANKKLRFIKGPAASTSWSINELIDGSCCTSPVALALTHTGAPRVAYGDGGSRADGLKYGVRTATGWKKSKAHAGRVKQVAITLDQTPGLFGEPPSNAPRIAFVVKKRGTWFAFKRSTGTSGAWDKRYLGKSFGPLDLTHSSNVTYIVYAGGGDLRYSRASGGIWTDGRLSGSGKDSKPQLEAGRLTFTRTGAATGIYYSRAK